MTGKEAKRLHDKLTHITKLLLNNCENEAFWEIGMLTEEMAQIVRIDQVSFNPTVKKEDPNAL